MRKTSACIITTVHPPFDTRIFHKQAKSLRDAGYSVTLISSHPRTETIDGIRIISLREIKNRIIRILFAPILAVALALRQKADIYHFHDPELIPEALLLRIFGKKVIYDMHELVADQIEDKQWIKPPLLRKIARMIYSFMELLAVKYMSHIILAEDGYTEYFSRTYSGFSNYTVIRNYPLDNFISDSPAIKLQKTYQAIYAGGLTHVRGIMEIIRAIDMLPNYRLTLMGPWGSEQYRKDCMTSPGWSKVNYMGNLPLDEVRKEMQQGTVGLCMLHPIKNYVVSLPVKAFEYMGCGLPMVMSDFPLWQKLFSECAVFADPYNPSDIAAKIAILSTDTMLNKSLANRGLALVKEKYNWQMEKNKLLSVYTELLKR